MRFLPSNALREELGELKVACISSVAELQDRITGILRPITQRFNLTLSAFGNVTHTEYSSAGELVLADAWGNHIEPAPMTPTVDSKPWDVLTGTIRAALKDSPSHGQSELVVVPGLALGKSLLIRLCRSLLS